MGVSTYPLSELKDFQAFRHNTQIRDVIFAERGLEGLADFLVTQNIIQIYQDNPNVIQQPLLAKLRKHYDTQTIATAIAQAWLDDADHFQLMKFSWLDKYGTKKLAAFIVFSVMTAILTTALIIAYHSIFHDIFGSYRGIEPFLVIPSAIVSWIVYEIVMRVWR